MYVMDYVMYALGRLEPLECNPDVKFVLFIVLCYEMQGGGEYHSLRIDIWP